MHVWPASILTCRWWRAQQQGVRVCDEEADDARSGEVQGHWIRQTPGCNVEVRTVPNTSGAVQLIASALAIGNAVIGFLVMDWMLVSQTLHPGERMKCLAWNISWTFLALCEHWNCSVFLLFLVRCSLVNVSLVTNVVNLCENTWLENCRHVSEKQKLFESVNFGPNRCYGARLRWQAAWIFRMLASFFLVDKMCVSRTFSKHFLCFIKLLHVIFCWNKHFSR